MSSSWKALPSLSPHQLCQQLVSSSMVHLQPGHHLWRVFLTLRLGKEPFRGTAPVSYCGKWAILKCDLKHHFSPICGGPADSQSSARQFSFRAPLVIAVRQWLGLKWPEAQSPPGLVPGFGCRGEGRRWTEPVSADRGWVDLWGGQPGSSQYSVPGRRGNKSRERLPPCPHQGPEEQKGWTPA